MSGASGLIGSALLPALRADGHDVVRLVRREPTGADEIRWDPAAGELDASRLEGTDAIVNLSGENIGQRWTDARQREILESRTSTTGLLARTAAALDPRPSVFVCASAIGAYGDRGDEILTEESELGSGFVADVARAWEEAADPAREAGIRVVHLRQGIVLANDGGALERMLLPFKLGVGGRIGSGKQWFSWVGMEDIVGAYRRRAEHRPERTRQRHRTQPGDERAVHEGARLGALAADDPSRAGLRDPHALRRDGRRDAPLGAARPPGEAPRRRLRVRGTDDRRRARTAPSPNRRVGDNGEVLDLATLGWDDGWNAASSRIARTGWCRDASRFSIAVNTTS